MIKYVLDKVVSDTSQVMMLVTMGKVLKCQDLSLVAYYVL